MVQRGYALCRGFREELDVVQHVNVEFIVMLFQRAKLFEVEDQFLDQLLPYGEAVH